jgi:hypothetical protein
MKTTGMGGAVPAQRVTSLTLARARRMAALRPAPVLEFARALSARHQIGVACINPLERVLAIPRVLAPVHRIERHLHLAFAPRVEMRLAMCASPERAQPQVSRAAPWSPAVALPVMVNQLVQRMLERVERVNTLNGALMPTSPVIARAPESTASGQARAASAEVLYARPDTTVPRVFRASALSASSTSPSHAAISQAPLRESAEESTRTNDVSATSRAIAAPALDVHALAERVVRVIDKRFTAQRERMGRL